MPLREKAKSLFKSKNRTNSLSKTNTNGSDRDRYPSNVYRPEEVPQPKYRRPPKKEHKEKLEAFNFSDAWRKKSFQSTHSPMGTRAPSRRTSLFSNRQKSVSSLPRKSIGGRSQSGRSGRTMSAASEDTEKNALKQREGMGAAMVPKLQMEPEQDGDDDVANVGISRVQTREKVPRSRPRTAESNGMTNGLHKTLSTAHDHKPFTEQDIATALSRSHSPMPAQA